MGFYHICCILSAMCLKPRAALSRFYIMIGLLVAPTLSLVAHPVRRPMPSLDSETRDLAAVNDFDEAYARE